MISQYRSIKDQKSDDILYMGQLAGHDAVDDNDISAIYYDACMLALFMNKEWRYLTNYDFCEAFEQAKRLGFRMPTNANKAFRRRKMNYAEIVVTDHETSCADCYGSGGAELELVTYRRIIGKIYVANWTHWCYHNIN